MNKRWIVCLSLLFTIQADAAGKDASPFDIDLSPDTNALETANKPEPSNAPLQGQSPISTVVQNMNPDISFVGDFLAGNKEALYNVDETIHRPVYLREIEIDGVGYVSPYAKALFVTSFSDEGADVEEANMNFFNLPWSLNLKLGKMLVDTDTLNPLHQHAIPFVDRPLAWHHAFGVEGLKTVGANLSVLVPNPWDHYILLSGTYGTNEDDQLNNSALYGGNNQTMLSNVRLTSSWDLNSTTYLNVDISGLSSPMPDGSLTKVYLADLLLRYAPDPYSNAVTFLNGYIWNRGDPFHTGPFTTQGFYNYLGWQFSPRWRVGARYDHSDNQTFSGKENEYTGILSYYPTETNYLRFQYGRHELGTGGFENKIWVQLDFTIGPHQQHTAL